MTTDDSKNRCTENGTNVFLVRLHFLKQITVYMCKCDVLKIFKLKVKVKSLLFNVVVPSARRLVSMEADGAPFTPLPLSMLHFTGS